MADSPSSSPHPDQQDPLAQALGPSKLEAFLEQNKKPLALGFVLFIALVVGSIVMVSQRQEGHLRASQAFASATSVAELNEVAAQGDRITAGNAILRKATLLESEGKLDEARATLLEFRNLYPEHPRFAQALLILGQMAENNGDRAKARDFYTQIPGDSDLSPLARMRLADLIFQEGRLAEAREQYTEIEREFAENPWSAPLQDRIKEANLLLNKPEWPQVTLEKPEPAPVPAPPAAKPGEPAPKPAPAPAAPQAESKPAPTQPAPAPKPAAPQAESKPALPKPASPQTPAESKPAPAQPATPKPAAAESKPAPAQPKPATPAGPAKPEAPSTPAAPK